MRVDELPAPRFEACGGLLGIVGDVGEDGCVESFDVVCRGCQCVERLPEIGLRRIIDSVGLRHDRGCIVAAQGGVGVVERVQIGDVQPWRLFDVRHQCVHDGRIRVAVQADQQIAFRIRLLHLVERALRDESRETPGRCSLAVRFGVGTGRLALCKVGKHALRGQYGDVAGVGGYYGLAGFRGGRIILFEIMRGDDGVVPLLLGFRQRVGGPIAGALPCIRGHTRVRVTQRRLIVFQGLFGVPLRGADACRIIGFAVVQRGIGGDVEQGRLRDAVDLRRHRHRLQIGWIGHHLQFVMLGERLFQRLESCLVFFAGNGDFREFRGGDATFVDELFQHGVVGGPSLRFERLHDGDIHRGRVGGIDSSSGPCCESVRFVLLNAIGLITERDRFRPPGVDGRQRLLIRVRVDVHVRRSSRLKRGNLALPNDIGRGNLPDAFRPFLDIVARHERVEGVHGKGERA